MDHLIKVPAYAPPNYLKRYKEFAGRRWRTLLAIGRRLRGARIIHVNATRRGGGVAELLEAQIPFERALGLESYWFAMRAPRKFFRITKKLHNMLQGGIGILAPKEKDVYLAINREMGDAARLLFKRLRPDLVVVHDPQPAALRRFLRLPRLLPMVSRFHLDLSSPRPRAMQFLEPFISEYDTVVVSNDLYRKTLLALPLRKIKTIFPAIDPLSPKNKLMRSGVAESILQGFGIHCERPIMTQISRFDPWKDPLGVIRAYYLAKNKIPDLQLILEGLFLSTDDPEAQEIFREVRKHARGDPDIFLFADPRRLREVSNDALVNALYTASTVIVQKSIREGFGLTITEAMWKGKAVVAGKTSGSLLQITHGRNGMLATSPEEMAEMIVRLVHNSKLRERMGRAAHRTVYNRFLFPRYMLDHLRLYQGLIRR